MGEDWHHKKARQYKRHMQEKAGSLAPAPLFDVPEEVEKQYMGHLDEAECNISSDALVTLFIASPKARPAILSGTMVIGRMEDDSAADAAQNATTWPVILQLRVLDRDPSGETLILSPLNRSKARCQ